MKASTIIELTKTSGILTETSEKEEIRHLFTDANDYYTKKLKAIGAKVTDPGHLNTGVHYIINIDNYNSLNTNDRNRILNKIVKKISSFFSDQRISSTKSENEIGFFNIHFSEGIELKHRISYYLLEASIETNDYFVSPGDIVLNISPFLKTRELQVYHKSNLSTGALETARIFCDEFKKMTDTLVKALRLFSA